MVGLYIQYVSFNGSNHKFRIDEYKFDGQNYYGSAHDKDAGEGREYRLRCLCGGDSWSDDGCHINQYVCECCDQRVSVAAFKEGDK